MTWRHPLAVAVGTVLGFGLSLAFGLVFGLALMAYYLSTGVPMRDLQTQLDTSHLCRSVPILLATEGVGGLAVLLAGFATGWIALRARALTGLVMGIISTVLTTPFFFLYPYPVWYDVLSVAVTLAAATAGAYIAQLIFRPRAA